MRLAFEFRNRFKKDVVVDLVCYRRYGHNEADEPAFTQPRMYELIDEHHPVRALYTQQLVQRGDITDDDEQAVEYDFKARLDRAFEETHAGRVARARRRRHRSLRRRRRRRSPARRRPGGHRGADGDARARGRRVDPCPGRLRGEPQAPAPAHRTRRDARQGRDRLGVGRGAGVRLARARGHTGATRGPGHSARHVQPASRRARRPGHRARVRTARAPVRRPGAVHALRHRAVGVRRARVRVRLLDQLRHIGVLGGAVRRLRQRRAGGHRPVHLHRRRQVGPAKQPGDAPPPRPRRSGARALQRAHRALPHALGRGQPAGRVPHHLGAVLPRVAPPGRVGPARAARVLHPEALPAHAAHALAARRVHRRCVLTGARRPRTRRTS